MAKKRKTELDIETGTIPVPEALPKDSTNSIPLEQEMPPQAEAAPEAGKPLDKNVLIVFGLIAAIVIVVGIIAGTALHKKKAAAAAGKADVHGEKTREARQQKPRKEVKFEKLNNLVLEPFLIPYKNAGKDGFIQVVFALQVNDPEVIDEINGSLPAIRSSILYAISTHDQTDLIDPAKREGLIKDLRYNIDRSLQSGRVEAVLLNALNVY